MNTKFQILQKEDETLNRDCFYNCDKETTNKKYSKEECKDYNVGVLCSENLIFLEKVYFILFFFFENLLYNALSYFDESNLNTPRIGVEPLIETLNKND